MPILCYLPYMTLSYAVPIYQYWEVTCLPGLPVCKLPIANGTGKEKGQADLLWLTCE